MPRAHNVCERVSIRHNRDRDSYVSGIPVMLAVIVVLVGLPIMLSNLTRSRSHSRITDVQGKQNASRTTEAQPASHPSCADR